MGFAITLGTPLSMNMVILIRQSLFLIWRLIFSFLKLASPFLKWMGQHHCGQHKDKSVYLLFSQADQGFAREAAGNVLTPDMLKNLPPAPLKGDHMRVVYAEGCTTSEERLRCKYCVQTYPYHIEGVDMPPLNLQLNIISKCIG